MHQYDRNVDKLHVEEDVSPPCQNYDLHIVKFYFGRRNYTQRVNLETGMSINYIPKTHRDCVINTVTAMSLNYIPHRRAAGAS